VKALDIVDSPVCQEGLLVYVSSLDAIVRLIEADPRLVCLADSVVATEAVNTLAVALEHLLDVVRAEALVNQILDRLQHDGSLGCLPSPLLCSDASIACQCLQFSYAYKLFVLYFYHTIMLHCFT